MAKIAIVMKSDDSIVTWYDADAPRQDQYGGAWGRPSESEHVELDPALDYRKVLPQWVEETGTVEDGDLVPAHYVLAEDPTLAAEVDAQDAADAKAALISAKKVRREQGLEVIDLIQVLNDAKNITVPETVAFMLLPEVQQIKALLESGALESAKDAIIALDVTQTDIKLDADDKVEIVDKLDEFLGL